MILFYDTETTGFVSDKTHIVQIGALLCEDSGDEIARIDLICDQNGWEIPDDVAKIHGITTEEARRKGINEKVAVSCLLHLGSKADLIVGHNVKFDDDIVKIATKRGSFTMADDFFAKKRGCTALLMREKMKIPPTEKMKAAGFGSLFKTPNLGEAYEYVTGEKLVGAHSAMIDVMACKKVFMSL